MPRTVPTPASMAELVPPFIVELITGGTPTQPRCTAGSTSTPNDVVVDKPRYGAFWGTDLEQQLRERGSTP